MANNLDFDPNVDFERVSAGLPLLSSDDQLLAGIRVTRAQFARMMNVSRQAVTEWVKAGRLTVGADDRFDPRKAVADLLRTGDPAKLRAKALQPLANEMSSMRQRIVDLESGIGQCMKTIDALKADLHSTREDREFHESAAAEYSDLFNALIDQLQQFWLDLAGLPESDGAGVVIDWLNFALQYGCAEAGPMLTRNAGAEEEGGEA